MHSRSNPILLCSYSNSLLLILNNRHYVTAKVETGSQPSSNNLFKMSRLRETEYSGTGSQSRDPLRIEIETATATETHQSSFNDAKRVAVCVLLVSDSRITMIIMRFISNRSRISLSLMIICLHYNLLLTKYYLASPTDQGVFKGSKVYPRRVPIYWLYTLLLAVLTADAS